jgi:hypothetical protein
MLNESEPALRGWIKPLDWYMDVSAHRRTLEAIGVQVGVWDMAQSEFQECVVPASAMEKLDSLWGQYIWGLSLS